LSKTVLFCWEIGEALGHISILRSLALLLKARGITCVFALKDLTYSYHLLNSEGFITLQAPVSSIGMSGPVDVCNYSEVLLRFGFLRADALSGQVLAWQSLFDYVKPDAIIVDSAPAARLASRGYALPVFNLSISFGCPPSASQWPAFASASTAAPARLRTSEQSVLSVCNRVADLLNIPPLHHIGELYPEENCYVTGVPALDHYERQSVQYMGAPPATSFGVTPQWPVKLGALESGEEPPRVFAYLKPNYPNLHLILDGLAKSPVQTIAFIPGISGADLKQWNTDNLLITTEPVNVDEALKTADIVICHGGSGLTHQTVLAGKPVLALPMHEEQYSTAKKLCDLGIGQISPVNGAANFKKILKKMMSDPTYSEKAKAFADVNRQYRSIAPMEALANRIASQLEG
jgi:hypothetical protein